MRTAEEKQRKAEAYKRYAATPKGKAARRKAVLKYFQTEKGRSALRRAVRKSAARQWARREQRYVSWADEAKISAFYDEAHRVTEETGIPHEVDHIIPLQGKTVSGLHVENNLRVVTKVENRAKRNLLV